MRKERKHVTSETSQFESRWRARVLNIRVFHGFKFRGIEEKKRKKNENVLTEVYNKVGKTGRSLSNLRVDVDMLKSLDKFPGFTSLCINTGRGREGLMVLSIHFLRAALRPLLWGQIGSDDSGSDASNEIQPLMLVSLFLPPLPSPFRRDRSFVYFENAGESVNHPGNWPGRIVNFVANVWTERGNLFSLVDLVEPSVVSWNLFFFFLLYCSSISVCVLKIIFCN